MRREEKKVLAAKNAKERQGNWPQTNLNKKFLEVQKPFFKKVFGRRRPSSILVIMTVILLLAGVVLAQDKNNKENKPEEPKRVKHRLEVKYMLEYLEPYDIYKPWRSLYFHYYGFPSPTFNYFIHFGTVYREGQNDYIGIIGAARDWTSRFYTYTAFVAGTESTYLPKFRFDHDLNFKFGKNREIVWTIGVTTIDYHHEANDLVISSGLTFYLPKFIIEYRLFRNRSNPGNYISYTHLASLGYGQEKKQWTYLTFSRGSQAYLALYVLTPEEVRQNAVNISAIHRRWLTRNFGFFIELNYVTLDEAYDKVGIFSGLFLEL